MCILHVCVTKSSQILAQIICNSFYYHYDNHNHNSFHSSFSTVKNCLFSRGILSEPAVVYTYRINIRRPSTQFTTGFNSLSSSFFFIVNVGCALIAERHRILHQFLCSGLSQRLPFHIHTVTPFFDLGPRSTAVTLTVIIFRELKPFIQLRITPVSVPRPFCSVQLSCYNNVRLSSKISN